MGASPIVHGMQIGILHPGAMGAVLGEASRHPVLWASEGRSELTQKRAADSGISDVGTLRALVNESDIIISVCPPDVAVTVAEDVARKRFDGLYVDLNAVSPTTACEVGAHFDRFVDGGIFGPPSTAPGLTRIYLSGPESDAVADIWDESGIDVMLLDGDCGSASALKMAYAGWTKGSAALLFAMRAYAESMGVVDELMAEWDHSIPGLTDRIHRRATGTGPKAWRFAGEMEEIAKALESCDLPPGFHEAAAEIYIRIADLRDIDHPTLEEVMAHLVGSELR